MKARVGSGMAVAMLAVAMLWPAVAGAGPNSAPGMGARELALPLTFSSLQQDLYGEYSSPVALVASSAAQWDAAMAQLASAGELLYRPVRSAEVMARELHVDWRHDSVVLVALGQVRAAEYSVSVRSVRHRGSRLSVDVVVEPVGGDLYSQVMTSPYQLVRIRRGTWERSVEVNYVAAVPSRGPFGAAAAGAQVDATWGSVKNSYR